MKIPCACSTSNPEQHSSQQEIVMKRYLVLTLFAALPLYAPAGEAPSSQSAPRAQMDMGQHMPTMQENMKRMQQQMDKIRQAEDPNERQKLMLEHMQTMQENMQMMHSMGGPMMMGMMGGARGGAGAAATSPDPDHRMQMMEGHMHMMQLMMEQMMQCRQMMAPSASG
jgi:hypothetical protein